MGGSGGSRRLCLLSPSFRFCSWMLLNRALPLNSSYLSALGLRQSLMIGTTMTPIATTRMTARTMAKSTIIGEVCGQPRRLAFNFTPRATAATPKIIRAMPSPSPIQLTLPTDRHRNASLAHNVPDRRVGVTSPGQVERTPGCRRKACGTIRHSASPPVNSLVLGTHTTPDR